MDIRTIHDLIDGTTSDTLYSGISPELDLKEAINSFHDYYYDKDREDLVFLCLVDIMDTEKMEITRSEIFLTDDYDLITPWFYMITQFPMIGNSVMLIVQEFKDFKSAHEIAYVCREGHPFANKVEFLIDRVFQWN